jgi:hypothetical protein
VSPSPPLVRPDSLVTLRKTPRHLRRHIRTVIVVRTGPVDVSLTPSDNNRSPPIVFGDTLLTSHLSVFLQRATSNIRPTHLSSSSLFFLDSSSPCRDQRNGKREVMVVLRRRTRADRSAIGRWSHRIVYLRTFRCVRVPVHSHLGTDDSRNIAQCSNETSIVVVSLVAQFLAGCNSHGTLANLSLSSKLVRSEITPILYETVILDGDRGWWREKRSAGEREWFDSSSLRENLRYTKYVYGFCF